MLKCLHFECLVLYLCANFQIISYAKEENWNAICNFIWL